MRIIFMGTPQPASTCLQALIDAQEQIVCVVSQPDRKKGRGLEFSPSPTKLLAQKYKLDVATPEKAKDTLFIEKIRSYNPDLIVVVAFGKILPKEILDIPRFGAINVHASLLPKYRGAAPIQWAIWKGETKTGITIMHLNETLDTGDIILQKEILIGQDDHTESLTEKLFLEGAPLLLRSIEQIKNGSGKRIPQKDNEATYAPIIIKEAGEIDWRRSAIEINNQVRALTPWPVAHTFYGNKMLKIWDSAVASKEKNTVSGEVIIQKDTITIACSEGSLLLKTVQYESGKKLSATDFFRGHKSTGKKILPS